MGAVNWFNLTQSNQRNKPCSVGKDKKKMAISESLPQVSLPDRIRSIDREVVRISANQGVPVLLTHVAAGIKSWSLLME